MNIFVLTEDFGGQKVYKKWIPLVNPSLQYVENIHEINDNNFSILTGGGFPNYYEVIDSAIQDINDSGNINRFVIAIDSEDMTRDEKYNEVKEFLDSKPCTAEYYILVQHFCLETWALGNKKVGPRRPSSFELKTYKNIFDVYANDPEYLPSYGKYNRSQFAFYYLKCMLREKIHSFIYTKSRPQPLLHPTYFQEVKKRLITTSHIQSFNDFLTAFSNN